MRLARPSDSDDDDGARADLTPLIDLVFLLLVFLILTTRFAPEEQVIGQLLPTKNGGPGQSEIEKMPVNIAVYPAGCERGRDLAWYRSFAEDQDVGRLPLAELRVGGERLLVDARAPAEEELDQVAAFVGAQLARFERPGLPRKEQDRIVIHCWSGMPWRFALWSYDAVRAYEMEQGLDPQARPSDGRAVDFAPPRLRNAERGSKAHELFEIVQLR
jgi:hypothetical protein